VTLRDELCGPLWLKEINHKVHEVFSQRTQRKNIIMNFVCLCGKDYLTTKYLKGCHKGHKGETM